MDWSGVDYLWIIVMFLSAVWTLILTALEYVSGAEWERGVILTEARSRFFLKVGASWFSLAPPPLHHEYNSCQQPVIKLHI